MNRRVQKEGEQNGKKRKLYRNRMYLKFSLSLIHPKTGPSMGVGSHCNLYIFIVFGRFVGYNANNAS